MLVHHLAPRRCCRHSCKPTPGCNRVPAAPDSRWTGRPSGPSVLVEEIFLLEAEPGRPFIVENGRAPLFEGCGGLAVGPS